MDLNFRYWQPFQIASAFSWAEAIADVLLDFLRLFYSRGNFHINSAVYNPVIKGANKNHWVSWSDHYCMLIHNPRCLYVCRARVKKQATVAIFSIRLCRSSCSVGIIAQFIRNFAIFLSKRFLLMISPQSEARVHYTHLLVYVRDHAVFVIAILYIDMIKCTETIKLKESNTNFHKTI